MKTMTCKQLGGACDVEFHGNTFEEIEKQSKAHGMHMIQQKDPKHLEAMNKMMALMQSSDPNAMQNWMNDRRQLFQSLDDH